MSNLIYSTLNNINNNSKLLLIKNISTLEDCSLDTANNMHMTNSKYIAANFDDVKEDYFLSFGIPKGNHKYGAKHHSKSADCLLIRSNQLYFIEFKNGNYKDIAKSVKPKARDSVLLFNDIVGTNLDFCRTSITYIVVYNTPMTSKNKFASRPQPGSGIKKQTIRFGLEHYNKVFFNNVHTYTPQEFQLFLTTI